MALGLRQRFEYYYYYYSASEDSTAHRGGVGSSPAAGGRCRRLVTHDAAGADVTRLTRVQPETRGMVQVTTTGGETIG